ncbi:MAG: hypothetical protein NC102_09795, partial [Clostridium sp.]|nr:hypothetical protein [Clostridium sp.]
MVYYTGKAQESVSVAILPFKASRIAQFMSDGNTQKPTPVYATSHSATPLPRQRPNAGYYISTGIYRCSTLDMNLN